MKRTLQTGDTQAICIQPSDSFVERCLQLTDAALQAQLEALARPPGEPKSKQSPTPGKAAKKHKASRPIA